MERKRIVIASTITVIVAIPLLSLILLELGISSTNILLIDAISLIFISVPMLSVLGLLDAKRSNIAVLQKKQPLVIRALVMFLVSPLLVGLIVYLAYPYKFITVPLVVLVMLTASLFFFITK